MLSDSWVLLENRSQLLNPFTWSGNRKSSCTGRGMDTTDLSGEVSRQIHNMGIGRIKALFKQNGPTRARKGYVHRDTEEKKLTRRILFKPTLLVEIHQCSHHSLHVSRKLYACYVMEVRRSLFACPQILIHESSKK